MADLNQFVQDARDAGYSGAEIQWHLMKNLGYPPAAAVQATRQMMGPPEAPRTIGMPSDTSFGEAVNQANPMPDWYQRADAAVNRAAFIPTTGGSPMSLSDIVQVPQSKTEAALLAAGALIPPAKILKGAKGAVLAGTRMLEGAAPEVGALSRGMALASEAEASQIPKKAALAYTEPEIRALAEYRSESDPVNSSLRQEDATPHTDVEHIESGLAKSSLPEEMTLYRGFSRPTGYSVGDTFTDKGFSSTTTDKDMAALEFGRRGEVAVIRVPKGTNAVRMSEVSHPDIWTPYDQGEVLLPRGVKYTVRKIEFDPTLGPNGKNVLYLDATPPGRQQ